MGENMFLQKLLAIIACMASSAWLASDYKGVVFPYDAFIATVTCVGVWIGLEGYMHSEKKIGAHLHPHDVKLGNQLRETFDPRTRQFLRDHSFGSPFHNDRLRNLEALADDWTGAEYEFENTDLDNTSAEFTQLIREFCEKIAIYAGPAERRPEGYLSVPLQAELGEDLFSENTTKKVSELNALSTKISKQFDAFERTFRRLAPEAYG